MAKWIDDWDQLARALGYENERDMLQKMYVEEELSLTDIAERLGFTHYTVLHHLEKLDIPRRSRGGRNRSPKQLRKLFLLDQRIVLTKSLEVIATTTQVSRSLIYKYRRMMLGVAHAIVPNTYKPSESEMRLSDLAQMLREGTAR